MQIAISIVIIRDSCDNDYESVRPVADVAVADFVAVHIADAPAADDDYGKIDYSIGETFVAMSSY